MPLANKKTIYDALKAKLESLTFSEGPFAGQSLFQSVQIHPARNISKATEDLIDFEDRMALIVPIIERFETDGKPGSSMSQDRVLEALVFVADKDYEPGPASFFGDDVDYPGVFYMSDQVIESLIGNSLELGKVSIEIVDAQDSTLLSAKDDSDAAREAYIIAIRISSGALTATLARGHRRPRS